MTLSPSAARALTLVGAYAAVGVLVYLCRAELVSSLLPAIGWVVDGLLPDGTARTGLGLVLGGNQDLVALDAALTRPLQTRAALVPAGESVHVTTLVAYAAQHAALIYAVLVAWPVKGAAARVALLLLGVPAVAAAMLLDIPFVLAGLLHELLLDAGTTDAASRGLAVYYEFIHRGGRAGLAIAVSLAVCLPFAAATRLRKN